MLTNLDLGFLEIHSQTLRGHPMHSIADTRSDSTGFIPGTGLERKVQAGLVVGKPAGFNCVRKNRELKQPLRRRREEHKKFAYLTTKNSIFARFALAMCIFVHFAVALTNLRREMTCFAQNVLIS